MKFIKALIFIIVFSFQACEESKQVSIFEENNESNESTQNLKSYDELIEFKSKEKDLNYLFEDTKFPADDYILKGGKKQHNQDVQKAFKEAQKKQESLDEIKKKQEAEFRKKVQQELLEKGGAIKGNILLDEKGNPILDANGNPMYDNILYDEYGNPILDANGNPRYKDVLYDENGYPIYDENGNLIRKQALKDNANKGKPITDNNGNLVLDKEGNIKYDNVFYNPEGNITYDKKGKIALKNDPEKGKILLDKNGNALLDANGEPMYENVLYDENGYPLLDENGNPLIKKATQSEALKQEKEELQKLIEEQKRLNQQMKQQITNQNNQGTNPYYPYNINALIRDSVLAERGNANIAFSKPNSRYGVDSFSNQKNIDEATHEHKLLRTIRAGRLIPALLTTAISSDIEGPVTAIVEQDIFAAMGKAVLIPRGSKVIGFYQNDNKIGQSRLSITWREIITPQGVNILLTNAITSDNMGMSGIEGYLNNKYGERYGIPYGISTLSNVLLLAIASKGSNAYTQSIYDQSSKDVSTLVESIIEQQSAIKPTIEIKQGSRIYITPSTHIWFPVPTNNEVLAEFYND